MQDGCLLVKVVLSARKQRSVIGETRSRIFSADQHNSPKTLARLRITQDGFAVRQ